MTRGLRELEPQDLSAELERALLPRLTELLRSRKPGHCMRVADLDADLMVRLCGRLRAEVPGSEVVILSDGSLRTPSSEAMTPELTVTSTKLVELRNPLPDGKQRPPLLVFLPANVRAAAEDSFGVATFEEVQLGDVYGELSARLLEELPVAFRGAIAEALRRLIDGKEPWTFADPVAVVRFLLTAKVNGSDAEAIGASLYELALVPDFELLAAPDKAPARVTRNRECMETLTWSQKSERGRVLDLGLARQDFRIRLGNFIAETGLEDPRQWTRRIVLDRHLWDLAFHRWEFEDGGEPPDSIFIGDVETHLPKVGEDEEDEALSLLIGQQVLPLGKGGVRKFNVTFRVDPHPSKVQGLAKLTAQVISKEHGPVGLVRGKSVWKSGRTTASVGFSRLGRVDWERGWHFVRVLAQTEDGDLVPLVDESGHALPWAADDEDLGPRPNESDLFYVLPDTEMEIEPPQRAVQREASLVHALTRLRFTALLNDRDPESVDVTSAEWAERRSRGRTAGSEMLEVKFGREGTVHVPVSRPLKVLEQKILAAPDGAISWRVPIHLEEAGQPSGDISRWPGGEAVSLFLAARARYFEAVRSGSKELITQGADLRSLRRLVTEYADAYGRLVHDRLRRAASESGAAAQEALAELRRILAVDTVALAIRDYRGRRRDAALVAPTHPLRALWLVTWAELSAQWLVHAKAAPSEFAIPTRDALLRVLAPVAFPPVLPTEAGRLLTAVDNLHPFWTLYAPSSEKDPRGLVGDVCAALGLPEPAIGGTAIDGAYLASRVRRYLVQHPYVRTLVVNAFNAGRGGVMADMLLELQKQPAFSEIRYDVRLFVPDADAPGVGEALAELLSPTASIAAKEADVFSTSTGDHLRPKLGLAVRPVAEFGKAPENHAAHLTLLFDLFPAEEVGAARVSSEPPSPETGAAPVHGLIQGFHVDYKESGSVVAWARQPRHGAARPLEGAEELADLLSTLPARISSATAAVATGETALDLRPVITLALDAEDRALLHQVHEVSDWVLTLDRNMGIEFFDHGGRRDRRDYLIDHSPVMTGDFGHRLVITSRSVAELIAILEPVLEQYRLKAEGRHAVAILDQLRSLSGRLALKLISAPTHRAEALGLALCRMYLEHQGVFENQIVVPLDAHLELYRVVEKSSDELGDEVSFKRTDLALFDLDAKARTITCRLVEVKCYNKVGDVSAFNQLKDGIAKQIGQSEEVLGYHFDPRRSRVDRPDRPVKIQELATLLEFYLDRAVRYDAMSDDAAEEARFFLRTLEDGYRLDFTRAAIIFDFDKPGTEPAEIESGIEFHRIGVDLIQELVEAAAPEPLLEEAADSVGDEPAERSMDQLKRRRERAPSVPTLEEAAFLGQSRDRSVSREELRTWPSADEVETSSSAAETTEAQEAPKPKPPAPAPESAIETAEPEPPATSPDYDVLLGATGETPQFGILGEFSSRKVALDLNETHTISLFGVQGGGKSYTLGAIAEMASLPIPNVNRLRQPLATVIFHYSSTMDYKPEFTTMVEPNTDESQVAALRERYGAEPRALADVVLLVPADKLEERRTEYPGIAVHPLSFSSAELDVTHWQLLMGAGGNRSTYIKQVKALMKELRRGEGVSLRALKDSVTRSDLADHLRSMALTRLRLAEEYIDDSAGIHPLVRPGRLIIVDLRDELIDEDEAFGLFFVLLQLIAKVASDDGRPFNKLFVFDEAHKYMGNSALVGELTRFVREMRHLAFSILVASQDPVSVPLQLVELSSQIILHKFNSPAWLKHLQKANAALASLTPEKMAHLRPGEAYIWSSKASDEAFTKGAIKITCRPRVTRHGGATKTAVGE